MRKINSPNSADFLWTARWPSYMRSNKCFVFSPKYIDPLFWSCYLFCHILSIRTFRNFSLVVCIKMINKNVYILVELWNRIIENCVTLPVWGQCSPRSVWVKFSRLVWNFIFDWKRKRLPQYEAGLAPLLVSSESKTTGSVTPNSCALVP